ncbi:MAG TPA: hypothetical protein VFU03_06490 [Gemmatimonadales bacterium]|nr:hypothetical protein [Gemmatimonadales bacterium]
MSHHARGVPANSPPAPDTWAPKCIESQLLLALEGLQVPAGPSWEALPDDSCAEVVVLLARLLARAGLAVKDDHV